ncbi:phosphotransferase [Actinomadura harenae]|uniref:Aminoglycoside phosphotransferase n=1 Tax=Actinomadura harenae TaxID=2483351 RepID=A0A3M2M0T3_9ACTN|nr:phosphotransferase [Actinomadura harenae]RMI43299.1 aminoglycoside phosphotransferase [Actinomadura harenae]
MRSDWADLPEDLRNQIEAETGRIGQIVPASTGNHADIASTVHTAAGRVFVKAARKLADRDGPEVMSLRREAAINPAVREFAPRLRWQTETGGWLALGFDHIEGRRADFTAGSPDLETLAKIVHALQDASCPQTPMLAAERRWQKYTDSPAVFAGAALLHTDLNEDNLIIAEDGNAYVVDWAFVTRGAPWLELMMLMPWLIGAGHHPRDADAWASQFPAWAGAPPEALNAFTAGYAAHWSNAAQARPDEWVTRHAALIGTWAAYRLEEYP